MYFGHVGVFEIHCSMYFEIHCSMYFEIHCSMYFEFKLFNTLFSVLLVQCSMSLADWVLSVGLSLHDLGLVGL
jgi:hypothetical protein